MAEVMYNFQIQNYNIIKVVNMKILLLDLEEIMKADSHIYERRDVAHLLLCINGPCVNTDNSNGLLTIQLWSNSSVHALEEGPLKGLRILWLWFTLQYVIGKILDMTRKTKES